MIVIAPYAKKLRNDKENPKNYPWWPELISMIDEPIVQVGIDGEIPLVDDFRKNLSIPELYDLIKECRTWISVDSFFQHLAWDAGKPGIVLFGQSDPLIFGHLENINLLKDRKYLREQQFWLWEQCEYNEDAFVKPKDVKEYLNIDKNKLEILMKLVV
jgi:ADP-heptose:LPS heptosyltransferase